MIHTDFLHEVFVAVILQMQWWDKDASSYVQQLHKHYIKATAEACDGFSIIE